MSQDRDAGERSDPFDLGRFVSGQAGSYETALAELRGGRKRSHWIWFIFPQLDGLGYSATTKTYAIKSIAEARAYLEHPLLGPRLLACAEAVLAVEGRSAAEILGWPDDKKLRSSMTLFAAAAGPDSVFGRVLDKYFGGEPDRKTLALLGEPGQESAERRPGRQDGRS